jgi:AraC-like DNA-binding protein
MSKSRQPVVRAVSVGFSSGYHWRDHRSDWGQLVWASRGVITVEVGGALWIVPPSQAAWLPPGAVHGVRMAGRGVLRRVYLQRAACRRLARTPQVIRVAPLLRELLRRVIALGTVGRARAGEARLVGVLLDELVAVPSAPVRLPMPEDLRARRAAEFARAHPAAARDPRALARHAGASVRTLERLFSEETGVSLGAWRQRARLVHAMTRLADGASVADVAFAVGYATPSAFVAAFRAFAGVTPGRYAAGARPGPAWG